MRVLHVIDSLRLGGAETLLATSLPMIRAEYGSHVETEVCVLYEAGPLVDRLRNAGIQLHSLNLRLKYDPLAIPRLRQLIGGGRYDIVHVHLFPADLMVALAARAVQRPRMVLTEHSSWNRRREWAGLRHLDRFTYSRYDRVLCVSCSVRDSLLSWLPHLAHKTTVLYNGTYIPPVVNNPVPAYDVICVGRLTRAKGIDIFLQAIAMLRDAGLVTRAALVGRGELVNEVLSQLSRLELTGVVEMLQDRTDVPDLLGKARVFVLPSRWEGLPLSLLEAMAARVPVVATAVGGVPEAITHERNGLLVRPGSSAALTAAIARLLTQPRLAAELASRARDTVAERFSLQQHVASLVREYSRLVGEGHA